MPPMDTLARLIGGSNRSRQDISQAAGITRERLNGLMQGEEPNLDELRRLASALNIGFEAFLPKTSTAQAASLLFRQTMGSVKPVGERAIDQLSERIDRSTELLSNGVNLAWLTRFEGSHSDFDDSERDAETFREAHFGGDLVSALTRLPSLLVDDLEIVLLVLRRVAIDGASVIFNGIPFLFVAAQFEPRMLFTTAHELGHLIAHHSQAGFARFDERNKVGTIHRPRQDVERFADTFASSLLLPRTGVGIALGKVRELYQIKNESLGDIEILYLAHVYGVSFQVAARRCEVLQLLPRGGAASLYEVVRRVHGSPEKRAEELQLPKRPRIFFPPAPKKLLEGALAKVERGEVSIERASESLNMPVRLFMEIHGRVSSEPHS